LSNEWEFKLEGEGVVSFTGAISELELVGVLVKFENLEDLGDNIEVLALLGGLVEWGDLAGLDDVVAGEMVVSPLLEHLLDVRVLSLVGGSLSGEGIWSIGVA